MKTLCVLIISLLCSAILQAQYRARLDRQSLSSLKIGEQQQDYTMGPMNHSFPDMNLEKHSRVDTVYNKYGDLRNDDPSYNPKLPVWRPLVGITGTNVITNLFDTYVLGSDFSRVGFTSWGRTLKAGFPWGPGWKWDQDRFGNNFLVHPYGGGAFFISARSSGYTFWESTPFALFGSYEWKIFGENGEPEREDLINTTITGIFAGEILYRLSSNVLDDRTTGWERFGREIASGLLSPTRTWTRFTQGRLFRVTSEDVYQTEPLNVTLASGFRAINDGTSFLTGPGNLMFNINIDYGNPFEVRSREPFDYFRFRLDVTKGTGRKIVDYVTGYALLFGKNYHSGSADMLFGVFQHWDYFDNWTYEVGTMAFGPGIIFKLPVSSNSNLYTNFHVAVVPFGGNSTRFGPDTSQFRDYDFVGGAEAKLESTLNLGSWINFTLIGYYFWLHTYVGAAGDNYIGLIEPRIGVTLFDNVSIGVEHLVYYTDRYTRDYGNFHQVRTEQRIWLQLYLESFKQQKQ